LRGLRRLRDDATPFGVGKEIILPQSVPCADRDMGVVIDIVSLYLLIRQIKNYLPQNRQGIVDSGKHESYIDNLKKCSAL
jgi:hypothetical protein